MDDRGQSALFDATLFFLVMAVASALILAYASFTFDAGAILSRETGLRYAADVREAVLRATLRNASYVNNGGTIFLGNITVERWLLEQLAVREAGTSASGFAEGNGRVRDLVRAALRPDYGFVLTAQTARITIAIGDGATGAAAIPTTHFDSTWEYTLPNAPTHPATIKLTIWPAAVSPPR